MKLDRTYLRSIVKVLLGAAASEPVFGCRPKSPKAKSVESATLEKGAAEKRNERLVSNREDACLPESRRCTSNFSAAG